MIKRVDRYRVEIKCSEIVEPKQFSAKKERNECYDYENPSFIKQTFISGARETPTLGKHLVKTK